MPSSPPNHLKDISALYRSVAEGNYQRVYEYLLLNPFPTCSRERESLLATAVRNSNDFPHAAKESGQPLASLLSYTRDDPYYTSLDTKGKYFKTCFVLLFYFFASPNEISGEGGNTAMHIAAGKGEASLLSLLLFPERYLSLHRLLCQSPPNAAVLPAPPPLSAVQGHTMRPIEKGNPLLTNWQSMTPRAVAEKEGNSGCATLLRTAEASFLANGNSSSVNQQTNEAILLHLTGRPPLAVDPVQALKEKIKQLTIQDSSDEEETPNMGPGKPESGTPSSSGHNNNNNYNNNNTNSSPPTVSVNLAYHLDEHRESSPTVLPTNEPFSNKDLKNFKATYGDGFQFLQYRRHYEIRGLLPYEYKKVVYKTPVIILIAGPCGRYYLSSGFNQSPELTTGALSPATFTKFVETHQKSLADPTSQAAGRDPHGNVSSPFTPHGGVSPDRSSDSQPRRGAPYDKVVLQQPRYKVLIDLEGAAEFFINQKALYIDALSGVVIPHVLDEYYYEDLVSFLKNVVIYNFQKVPPLTTKESVYAFRRASNPAVDKERSPLYRTLNIRDLGNYAKDGFFYYHSGAAPRYFKDVFQLTPKATGAGSPRGPMSRSDSGTAHTPRDSKLANSHCNDGSRDNYRKVRTYQILKELSLFGDGLFKYIRVNHPTNGVATRRELAGFIPLYRQRPKKVVTKLLYDHEALSRSSYPSNDTSNEIALATDTILTIRVRIVFRAPVHSSAPPSFIEAENAFFELHPSVYLVDSVPQSSSHTSTGMFNAGPSHYNREAFTVLLDPQSRDGLVSREALAESYKRWEEGSSTNTSSTTQKELENFLVYQLLLLLQEKLTTALEDYLASRNGDHAKHYDPSPVAGDRTGGGGGKALTPQDAVLDSFFTPAPRFPSDPSYSKGFTPDDAQSFCLPSGKCILCYYRSAAVVLHPCQHLHLCEECAIHRPNRCQVCHKAVVSASEVYF